MPVRGRLIPRRPDPHSPFAADAKHLKGLLARRALHSTFPNIIIGGRSIGGADDLVRMEADGSLAKLLEDVTGAGA